MNDTILKVKSIHTNSLYPLFVKMIDGNIPFNQIVCEQSQSHKQGFLLDLFFNQTSVKTLEKHADFFIQNKNHPFFQRLLFGLEKQTGIENAPGKFEFLCKNKYDPNTMFTFEHVFYKDSINFLECIGLTPLISCTNPKNVSTLLQHGASLHIKNKKQIFLNTIYLLQHGDEFFKNYSNTHNIKEDVYLQLKKYLSSSKCKVLAKGSNKIPEYNCFEWAEFYHLSRKMETIHNFILKNGLDENFEKQLIAPSYVKQMEKIDKYKEFAPQLCYKLLLEAMKSNNPLVLEKLDKYQEVIIKQQEPDKNFIFEIIRKSKLAWLEKVWGLNFISQYALNQTKQTYLEVCLNGKNSMFNFIIKNTDFSAMPNEQVNRMQKLAHSLPTLSSNKKSILENLMGLKEEAILQIQIKNEEGSINNKNKIKIL